MKVIAHIAALTLATLTASAAMAQNADHAKPIVKTTCADYISWTKPSSRASSTTSSATARTARKKQYSRKWPSTRSSLSSINSARST